MSTCPTAPLSLLAHSLFTPFQLLCQLVYLAHSHFLTLLGTVGATGPGTNYRGFVDALRIIAREEGLCGLYRGLAPSLLLISHGSINFMVYEELKLAVKHWRASNGDDGRPGAQDYVLAGLGAKIAASLVTYPLQVGVWVKRVALL